MEATIDGFSKPDMFLVLVLAAPPVLLGNVRWVGVDAGLAGLHVAENLHGVQGAALVGVNPIVSCRGRRRYPMRAQVGRPNQEGQGCPGETERLMGTQGAEAQVVRATCSQREGRCREPGARRPGRESPGLNRGASQRAGVGSAWWTELSPDVTSALWPWQDRSQGCTFFAVGWRSDHLPAPSRPGSALC